MVEQGFIKPGREVDFVKLNEQDKMSQEEFEKSFEKYGYPWETLHGETMTVGGKVVSYATLEEVIMKRFHSCL